MSPDPIKVKKRYKSPKAIARAALAIIEERGRFLQHELGGTEQGQVCTLGALETAAAPGADIGAAVRLVEKHLPKKYGGSIPDANDDGARDTARRRMIRVLRKAVA